MEETEWIETVVKTTDDGQRYVLREDIFETLCELTADRVGDAVTQDWNNGAILDWIASEHDDVFALTDDLPPEKIEGMNYNCSFSDEAQKKIDAYEQQKPPRGDGRKRLFNWGVLDWWDEKKGENREIVAFSDIDRYACKYWDWCEGDVYTELEQRHNMKIINTLDDLE